MAVELYNDGQHKCIMFHDLVAVGEDGVQANQFLIVDGEHSVMIDPGGDLIYNDLFMRSYKYLFTKSLDFIIGSHQDPDVISSLDKWLVGSECKVIVPTLWERFIPHFSSPGKIKNRLIGIPEQGMDIQLGNNALKAIPAHFLHSEGNFQFYDPVSKILFSGDLCSSVLEVSEQHPPVENFESHIHHMEGFHKRYMGGNKACRYWVNMVRQLDVEWVVPQHGKPFQGKPMIEQVLNWIENLQCGIDLMTQEHYQLP